MATFGSIPGYPKIEQSLDADRRYQETEEWSSRLAQNLDSLKAQLTPSQWNELNWIIHNVVARWAYAEGGLSGILNDETQS